MVDKVDEKELCKFNIYGIKIQTADLTIKYLLQRCQKTKKTTLEEKLIADGYIKTKHTYMVHSSGGYPFIRFTKEKGEKQIIIDIYENMHIDVTNDKISIQIPCTEYYEVIKKAIELVKKM